MMTWNDVRDLAMTLPEVTEGKSYGAPAMKVGKHLLVRLREEVDAVALFDVPQDEREMLMASEPELFFSIPHYDNYAIVLARLEMAAPDRLFPFIERRWRARASKRALKLRDG